MFLAVIAFTLSSFRHYIMFNNQNLVDDDNTEDEDETSGSTLLDKIRSIVTYVCTYLWAISFILLIFIIYASLRGPFNIINSFNTGKTSPKFCSFFIRSDAMTNQNLNIPFSVAMM